jgi:hypothetical protein
MVGVIDATCEECDMPLRWSAGTPRMCELCFKRKEVIKEHGK